MAYIGNIPAESYASFERQVFTIVNSQTAYTLTHAVTNENDIRLVVNNVVQEPGSGKAYTASGTTLTLSAALVNGTDEMYCVYLGRALQTVNPPNASVGTAQLADSSVSLAKLSATGTKNSTTFLRGDNTFASAGSDFTPNFLAYLGSSQTLATNTTTLIQFNTEVYDSDSSFNTTSYNYTIPSGEAGKYVLYFQLRRESFAGTRFFGTIIRTRSGTESDVISAEANAGSDSYDTVYSMIVADCLAGDTFHVIAKHFDSGNKAIYGNASSSFFGGYKLI